MWAIRLLLYKVSMLETHQGYHVMAESAPVCYDAYYNMIVVTITGIFMAINYLLISNIGLNMFPLDSLCHVYIP